MMAYYYPPNLGYVAQPVSRQPMGYCPQEQRQIPVIVPSSSDFFYGPGQLKPVQSAPQQTSVANGYAGVGPYESTHLQGQQNTYLQPNYPQSAMNQNLESPNTGKGINFLQLISYTILPLLKRKRRNSGKQLITSVHEAPAQSFPCAQCDKVFQKPYNLKLHMKTHSTDKPFTCSYCDRKFARLHDKKRHESLHGGVKNFKCEGFLKNGVSKWGCGKKFARSDALLRHFRTETGWLCIKPLMDEAKETDSHNPFLQNHLNLPHSMPLQAPESSMDNHILGSSQSSSPHLNISNLMPNFQQTIQPLFPPPPVYEQELVENTKFIRKLIQKY